MHLYTGDIVSHCTGAPHTELSSGAGAPLASWTQVGMEPRARGRWTWTEEKRIESKQILSKPEEEPKEPTKRLFF